MFDHKISDTIPSSFPARSRYWNASRIHLLATAYPYAVIVVVASFAAHIYWLSGGWPHNGDWPPDGTFYTIHYHLAMICCLGLVVVPLLWFISAAYIWRGVEMWMLVRRWLSFSIGYCILIVMFMTDQANGILDCIYN
jgi:hypothetical protein